MKKFRTDIWSFVEQRPVCLYQNTSPSYPSCNAGLFWDSYLCHRTWLYRWTIPKIDMEVNSWENHQSSNIYWRTYTYIEYIFPKFSTPYLEHKRTLYLEHGKCAKCALGTSRGHILRTSALFFAYFEHKQTRYLEHFHWLWQICMYTHKYLCEHHTENTLSPQGCWKNCLSFTISHTILAEMGYWSLNFGGFLMRMMDDLGLKHGRIFNGVTA